jgi:aconitate hydratase
VKNAVMEFFGPGIGNLAMDYRSGIDVMTTETSCLSSIWETDETVQKTLELLGRGGDYQPLHPAEGAYYDRVLHVALDQVECMIALPFHPSCAVSIHTFNENLEDLLHQVEQRTKSQLELKAPPESLLKKIKNGKFYADQGVIAGCSGGTYQNLTRTAEILNGQPLGSDAFWLSAYPASMPVMMELSRTGSLAKLMASGVSIRSAFCGPCFGAGDVPANGAFSIRHSTRNFPNREGSKPGDGQVSYVALMDARSIAASALNGGAITAATDLDLPEEPSCMDYQYDDSAYKARVYYGVGKAQPQEELVFGPNIADWPEQIPMPENLLLEVASAIYDPLTTTDELIPSGETSSYRSNPLRLSEFALSRKDPQYVPRAKEIQKIEQRRREDPSSVASELSGCDPATTGLGSVVMSIRPGDGSAREQAASCQRVLGGCANLCLEYATKRYRSNVINWGMVPFTVENIESLHIQPGDRVYIPGIRQALLGDTETISATLIQPAGTTEIRLDMKNLQREERDIILSGCLINYYAGK